MLLFLCLSFTIFHFAIAEPTDWEFVEWVEKNAFFVESFEGINNIPTDYEVIDGVLFKNLYLFKYPGQKKISYYQVPDGTIGIEKNAFRYKEADIKPFDWIYLPKSCIDIGFDSNYICSDVIGPLWYISSCYIVDEQNQRFSSNNGILYSKDETILLIYPKPKVDQFFQIPEGTKIIGAYAFDSSALTTIISPKTLETIEEGAFYNSTSLRHFVFSDSLKVIKDYAFQYCNSLSNIVFPSELLFIGYNAFHSCWNIKELYLPSKLTTLCSEAFLGCNVKNIFLPASLKNIGSPIVGNDEEICFSVLESSYPQEWCVNHNINYTLVFENAED